MTQILEHLAQEVGQQLMNHNMIAATAESCTAGGLSYWLTFSPGSSAWFDRAAITYSNNAKIEMLGVRPATLNKLGAVSEGVACEMAEGILSHSKANISLSITGIAGPDGGTKDKPVGTVWFATAMTDQETKTDMQIFDGDRQSIRLQTIEHALNLIKKRIK